MYKANIRYKKILEKLYINLFRFIIKDNNENVVFFFKPGYFFYILKRLIYNIYTEVK
jgi:hypothetical protein